MAAGYCFRGQDTALGLPWMSEEDADGGRPGATLGEQALGQADVDVLARRERPGLIREVAGVHQDFEPPVEDRRLVCPVVLLLNGGHDPNVCRPGDLRIEASHSSAWTIGRGRGDEAGLHSSGMRLPAPRMSHLDLRAGRIQSNGRPPVWVALLAFGSWSLAPRFGNTCPSVWFRL